MPKEIFFGTLVKQLCHSSPRNKHEIKTGTKKKQIGEKPNSTERRKTLCNIQISRVFNVVFYLATLHLLWKLSIFQQKEKGEKDIIIISCFLLVFFGSLERVSFQACQLFNSIVKLLMIRCQFSLTIFTHFISILPIEFTLMHFIQLHCGRF